jgi:hypothetical protein
MGEMFPSLTLVSYRQLAEIVRRGFDTMSSRRW